MSAIQTTDELFFSRQDLDKKRIQGVVDEALKGTDDGELFFEYRQSESLTFDDGRLKNASFDTTQGFGLRAVAGESAGYAHSSEISEPAIRRAADTVKAVRRGHAGTYADPPSGTNRRLYGDFNPLAEVEFSTKVRLLQDIDAYARKKDPRVRQVSATIAGSWQAVRILRSGGYSVGDIRPMVRLTVSLILGEGDRQESGSESGGGRIPYDIYLKPEGWQAIVDEAIRAAAVNLTAVAAPAGEMPVVLGPGWTGVMLHEAVGHGLEGDFNRKKTSTFSDRIGQRVASPGVTVVDDGTLQDRRGSITVDDEGTPSGRTLLIEDGILRGYMQDRQNARLMGMKPTGNGRRESFAASPMPRMTNTLMLAGPHSPEEIIKSVKRGLYAVDFSGGQVDITSGKFVFAASEAYLIEDGRIGPAVKGAMLTGSGPDAMTKVRMVGNDMKMDGGVGTCGKEGQSVPVGVGQPTLLMDGITVGGTG
ncbi:MAG: metalloprotease TldD [Alphaproteobacteria bacterium]|nr:metalloprotease TldD [Alphaproteobacteria bacterium]